MNKCDPFINKLNCDPKSHRNHKNKTAQLLTLTSVWLQKRVSVELPEDLSTEELRNVMERETDLQDQLKFAEEDLKRTRAQMQELENENEELLQKLARLNESGLGRVGARPTITRSARWVGCARVWW